MSSPTDREPYDQGEVVPPETPAWERPASRPGDDARPLVPDGPTSESPTTMPASDAPTQVHPVAASDAPTQVHPVAATDDPTLVQPAVAAVPRTGDRPVGQARRDLRPDPDPGAPLADDLPEPPSRRGAGRHVVGVVLGLILTPVGLLLTGIGTARLSDVIGTADPFSDALGATLLLAGALVLVIVVLLGLWSAAVPITGGLVWGVGLGLAYLTVPGALDETVDVVFGDRGVPAAVDQLAEGAMSGELLVTGTLLLAAGLAIAAARRAGRRWAEAVARAERARADAAIDEAARARAVRVGTEPDHRTA